ncbi:hypothetical protein KIM372_11380 [Bombiscardovia nodaiensis]|uniref:Uncharacterized protein n=1 Tax=Bombiscardovia nodaiensis TaxID=2932181 RepID=A0ABN6SAR1_9BIFI|nr:hypothetical protein KIM372_11380 [Bombiscardovia nodaiensis]
MAGKGDKSLSEQRLDFLEAIKPDDPAEVERKKREQSERNKSLEYRVLPEPADKVEDFGEGTWAHFFYQLLELLANVLFAGFLPYALSVWLVQLLPGAGYLGSLGRVKSWNRLAMLFLAWLLVSYVIYKVAVSSFLLSAHARWAWAIGVALAYLALIYVMGQLFVCLWAAFLAATVAACCMGGGAYWGLKQILNRF